MQSFDLLLSICDKTYELLTTQKAYSSFSIKSFFTETLYLDIIVLFAPETELNLRPTPIHPPGQQDSMCPKSPAL